MKNAHFSRMTPVTKAIDPSSNVVVSVSGPHHGLANAFVRIVIDVFDFLQKMFIWGKVTPDNLNFGMSF